MTNKPLIFLSHIHEERELAIKIQTAISQMFLGGVEFFVSSDRHSLRGGDEWLSKIRQAITESCLIIVLISRRSLDRTWINFEAGAGWLDKKVIPICHSGIKPAQLPQPLQTLFSLDIYDPYDIQDLCQQIGKNAGLEVPEQNWQDLSDSLASVASQIGIPSPRPFGATDCWVFPKSEDLGTIKALEESISRCAVINFCAIGLNFFWNASYLRIFEERIINNELRAKICMANFQSKLIKCRLDEEPEHPIGVSGSEHLLRRLLRLESKVGDKSRFSMKVFGHYPTCAILQFDEELYVYPYGYKTLGNFSPTFYWKGKDPAIQFFSEQFMMIWRDSEPAENIYEP